jgi:hypothetical protein
MTYAEIYEYDAVAGTLSRKPRSRTDFMSEWHYQEHIRTCGRTIGVRSSSKNGRRIAVYVQPPRGKAFTGLRDTLAHRIIWKLVHGNIPDGMHIDHINGDPWDNRICNLRCVSRSENMQNSAKHSTGIGRVKGVSWDKHNKKWQSEIRTNGGRVFLGRFESKGMAALAYAKASLRYHGRMSYYARGVFVQ